MGACAAKAAQIKDQHDPSDNIPKKKKKKLTRAQKEVDAVLNHLAVPTMAVKKFLTFFKKMDDDSSGSISLEEFIVFLKLDNYYTAFIERCFGAMDFNKKGTSAGALDPTEFTVGLYNMCIMTKDLLEDYVFNLYDEVHDGNLYKHSIKKMVSESQDLSSENQDKLVETVFNSLDKDGDGHISKKEFFKLDSKVESILKPLYIMQDTLQKRCLGQNFWDEERDRMKQMLDEYKEPTIIDLLANRVAAKYEAERIQKLKDSGEYAELMKVKAPPTAELVKGFDEGGGGEKRGIGKGFVHTGNSGPIITAADQRAKKEKFEKQKKEKEREARRKAGKSPEKKKKKKKEGGGKGVGGGVVSVIGVQKKQGAESWAMKHQEEMAINQ